MITTILIVLCGLLFIVILLLYKAFKALARIADERDSELRLREGFENIKEGKKIRRKIKIPWLKIRTVAVFLSILLGVIVIGTLSTLQFYYPRPIPIRNIKVSTADTIMLNRGKYLVNNVTACNQCHSPRDWDKFSAPIIAGRQGEGAPDSKLERDIPGKFYIPNITPHNLGNWSDGEIYRALTSGISKNDRLLFPYMPWEEYGTMTDYDLKAIISYLRTTKAIPKESPISTLDFPLNLIQRTFDRTPQLTNPDSMKTEIEKGKYLARIANCKFCHSQMVDNKFPDDLLFAGGRKFTLPTGGTVYSANLTPHDTGLKSWTAESFVAKFKGMANPGNIAYIDNNNFNSPMPWTMYANMEVKDLEAIFKYLQTLQPIPAQSTERFIPD